MEEEKKVSSKINWFFIISPGSIAAFLCFIGILEIIISAEITNSPRAGYDLIGVMILVPVLIVFIIIDLLMKIIVKKVAKTADAFSLWLCEIIMVGLIVFFFWWFIMGGAETL